MSVGCASDSATTAWIMFSLFGVAVVLFTLGWSRRFRALPGVNRVVTGALLAVAAAVVLGTAVGFVSFGSRCAQAWTAVSVRPDPQLEPGEISCRDDAESGWLRYGVFAGAVGAVTGWGLDEWRARRLRRRAAPATRR